MGHTWERAKAMLCCVWHYVMPQTCNPCRHVLRQPVRFSSGMWLAWPPGEEGGGGEAGDSFDSVLQSSYPVDDDARHRWLPPGPAAPPGASKSNIRLGSEQHDDGHHLITTIRALLEWFSSSIRAAGWRGHGRNARRPV